MSGDRRGAAAQRRPCLFAADAVRADAACHLERLDADLRQLTENTIRAIGIKTVAQIDKPPLHLLYRLAGAAPAEHRMSGDRCRAAAHRRLDIPAELGEVVAHAQTVPEVLRIHMVGVGHPPLGDLIVRPHGVLWLPAVLFAEVGDELHRVFIRRLRVPLRRSEVGDGKLRAARVMDLRRLAHLDADIFCIAGTSDMPAFIIVWHTVQDLAVAHHVVHDVLRSVALPVVPQHLRGGLGRADGVEHNAFRRQPLSGFIPAVTGAKSFDDLHYSAPLLSCLPIWCAPVAARPDTMPTATAVMMSFAG